MTEWPPNDIYVESHSLKKNYTANKTRAGVKAKERLMLCMSYACPRSAGR